MNGHGHTQLSVPFRLDKSHTDSNYDDTINSYAGCVIQEAVHVWQFFKELATR